MNRQIKISGYSIKYSGVYAENTHERVGIFIKGEAMAINSISGGSTRNAIGIKKTLKSGKTEKSEKAFGIKEDKVKVRDTTFALRLYSQKTLDQLKSVMQEAANKLGIDLNTVDASSEATANRIVNFALGMYGTYQKQHPEMSEEERLAKYEKLITNAINKGYGEAVGILQGMGVSDKQTMAGIQKTHDLIFQKISNFFESRRAELQTQA